MLVVAFAFLAFQSAPAPPAEPRADENRPRANLGSYFSTDDYPVIAWMSGTEGTVRFRIAINPEGRVAGVVVAPSGRVQACAITRSSGSAALDAATCAIFFTRVRYSPALDAAGRPVDGQDVGRVTWRLPG